MNLPAFHQASPASRIPRWFLAILFPVLTLGCLSLSFGGGSSSEEPSRATQHGSVALHPGEELDVYYPVPYTSPPNLRLEDSLHSAYLLDQKPDHFRVKNAALFHAQEVSWTARGVTTTVPVSVVSPVSTTAPVAPVEAPPATSR
jgi:hypothetical protein